MKYFSALALHVALVLPAAAQMDATEEIARFLDDSTFLVVRVDAARLKAEDLIGQIGKISEMSDDQKENLKVFFSVFSKAGGKTLYAVWGLDAFPEGPSVVVPLGADSDEKLLLGLLKKGPLEGLLGRGSFAEAVKLHQAIVVGDARQIQRLRAAKPAARPEFAQALAAVDSSPIAAILSPSANLRRALEELLPNLPKELGGGPTTALSRGFRWAALGMDAPLQGKLRVKVQAQDGTAAKALLQLRNSVRQTAEKEKHDNYQLLSRLLAPLTPTEDGNSLNLAIADHATVLAPLVETMRRTTRHSNQMNHLRQVAITFHMYNDTYRHIPPAVFRDKQGKALLSWRVHVLPYIEQDALYKEFHLDEPWDSEHNKKLIPRMPRTYWGPNANLNKEGKTTVLVPRGPNTAFPDDGTEIVIPKDFPDGTSNTIWLVQADDDHAVIWTKPDDLPFDPQNPRAGLSGKAFGRVLVGMADGSTRSYPSKMKNDKAFGVWFIRNSGIRREEP